MSKAKLRLITIISLAVLFVMTLSLAIGVLPTRRVAGAASKYYAPSSLFSSGTGGAVSSNRPESVDSEDSNTYWVQLSFDDGGSVYYRDRDIALKWFEADEESESALANPGVAKYFSMTFAFEEIVFDTFDIVFESAEENITKNGQSTNKLHFVYADGKLSVAVWDSSYDEEDEKTEAPELIPLDYTAGQDITLSLSEPAEDEVDRAGKFVVSLAIDGTPVEEELGCFTNIGGYFLEYRSSAATTPQTPMTFKAKIGSGEKQNVLMKSLNGQSFEVGADGVEDNAKPVLVLNEAVYSFRLGQRFSLTYEAIDVCDTSVTVSRSYYMATKEGESYKKPSEATSSSDYKTLTTSTFFMPTSNEHDDKAYVSIRFKLNDDTFTDYFVYLTWYAANLENDVETLGGDAEEYWQCLTCEKKYDKEAYEALGETCDGTIGEGDDAEACTAKKDELKYYESNAFDYIVVNLEAKGPSYIGVVANEETKENDVSDAAKEAADLYQKAVDEAAEGISAGTGAYFYLPSLRNLISSEYADYRNLRFSIYYFKPGATASSTATSATSLRYNNLRFEVNEIGDYRFRIIAQDASSNTMKYYDEDGELVSITSSNVWDIEGIPEFTFYVDYEGPSVEKKEMPSDGYRDRTYSIESFDIIAVGDYETEYTLMYINEANLPEDVKLPSYDTLVGDLENWIAKLEEYDAQKEEGEAKILRTIGKYNAEYTEDEYPDNAYAWNPDSSLSFCPQAVGTYIVRIDVTDSYLVNVSQHAYQAIQIRDEMITIPGTSRWLQNNLTAIILFSISALLLVAIIVLFVVKPSDKTVEEVDLESLKGSKKSKKE